jgi:G:T/U-mismatch repair DNA glycosylase
VLPELSATSAIELLKMPSTSPANAGMSFAQKLAAWRCLLDYID